MFRIAKMYRHVYEKNDSSNLLRLRIYITNEMTVIKGGEYEQDIMETSQETFN